MDFELQAPDELENNKPKFPSWATLLFLFLTILVCSLIGALIIYGLGESKGLELQTALNSFDENATLGRRNFIRTVVLINHLTMFVIPALIFAIFFYKKKWAKFLGLNQVPRFINMLGGVFFLLLAFPFIQFTMWLNSEWIPMPAWAKNLEDSTADMINGLLVANSSSELLFNVLVIALIPAIGEELIFRGIIQRKLSYSMDNPVLAIWLTAVLFSAFHMQFEGFIPRMLLGALLGYLFYWTQNLWVPILAHFMNNFLQIIAQHLYREEITDLNLDKIETVPFWQWSISLLLMLGIGYYLWKFNKEHQQNIVKIQD